MSINAHDSIDTPDTHLTREPVRRMVHPDVTGGQSLFRRLAVGMMALVAGETMDMVHTEPNMEKDRIIVVEDNSGELPEVAAEVTNTPMAGPTENLTMTAAELVGDQTQEFTDFYTTYSTFDGYQASYNPVVA